MPAYLINIFPTGCYRSSDGQNKSLPVLSGRKGRKNSSTEQAAMIEETEFIPIDRETTIAPMAVQALPQKERRQVITETEKQ